MAIEWRVQKHVGKGKMDDGLYVPICEALPNWLLWVVVTPKSWGAFGEFMAACQTEDAAHEIADAMNSLEAEKLPDTHESELIASWLEGLSRHPACPSERRFWYQGVAADIRGGAHLHSKPVQNAMLRFREKLAERAQTEGDSAK